MPAISKLSKAEWDEIRTAIVAGVSYRQVSERYEIEEGAIRKRAHKEQWPTPSRVESLVEQRRALVTERNKGQERPDSGTLIADSLLKNGETGSLAASKLLLALLQNAKAEQLKPLQDVQDVATAGKAIRTMAGLDKPQTAVQVNLGGFFRPLSESDGCVVVESSEVDEET